jgi:hypothetical protein
MINFIDDNVFIPLYVSYAILLFKNILGIYIVMSPTFQNGTRSKTARKEESDVNKTIKYHRREWGVRRRMINRGRDRSKDKTLI